MKLKIYKPRYKRRKPDMDGWENTIESLAMNLCPTKEWQHYEKQVQYLAWKANKRANTTKVKVFPIWRKYRQKAAQVAILYQAMPILKRFPLRFTAFLGELLLK